MSNLQCVKTGCNAMIAGAFCYGDLYTVGDALSSDLTYIMRVSSYQYGVGPDGVRFHLSADSYQVWWDRDTSGSVSTIVLGDIDWFDYNGR